MQDKLGLSMAGEPMTRRVQQPAHARPAMTTQERDLQSGAARPVGFQHRAGCLQSGISNSNGCRPALVAGGESSARMLRHQASVLGPITCFVEWAVVLTHQQDPGLPVEFLKLQLNNYVHNVLQEVQVSHSTVIVALLYIHRFFGQRRHCDLCGPCLFVIALVTAYKYVEDLSKLMKEWVAASGLTIEQLKSLEMVFLRDLKFCLAVNPEEFRLWKELYEREPLVGWWRGQAQAQPEQYQRQVDSQYMWMQPMAGGMPMQPGLPVDGPLAPSCPVPPMAAGSGVPGYVSSRTEPTPMVYVAHPHAEPTSYRARQPSAHAQTPHGAGYPLVLDTDPPANACHGPACMCARCLHAGVVYGQWAAGGKYGLWAAPHGAVQQAKEGRGPRGGALVPCRDVDWLGGHPSALVPYVSSGILEGSRVANDNGTMARRPWRPRLGDMSPQVEVELLAAQGCPDVSFIEASYQQGYDSEAEDYCHGHPGQHYMPQRYMSRSPMDGDRSSSQYSLFSHSMAPYSCFFPWGPHMTDSQRQQRVPQQWDGLYYHLFQAKGPPLHARPASHNVCVC